MQENNKYLETGKIGKLLLKFSVPCVLSMLVSALYNIVDQIFIGHKLGYLGNSATNVVYPFTVAALSLALLIGDGTAALLSLSLGSKDKRTTNKCVGNGITVLLFSAAVLTLTGFIFTDDILYLFGVTETGYQYASDYMKIILIGIPFYIFTSGMNSVIRADGSPGYSMFATVLGAVINLILDPIAIFIFDMDIKGAAAATVIGQVASCIVTVLYFKRPKNFNFSKKSFKPDKNVIKRMMQLGVSSFITQISIVIVISVVNNLIGIYGPRSEYGADIPLSAIGIVMKVFGIVIAFSVGISVGGQPITGYNYGAGNYKRVLSVYKYVIFANMIVGTVSMLIFEMYPQIIISLFGNESELYNRYAEMCFRIYLGGILLCCIQKASSIFLQSIGKPMSATILSLSRDVVFLVTGTVVLSALYGVEGMLWAGLIADVLVFILTILLICSEIKKMKQPKVHS